MIYYLIVCKSLTYAQRTEAALERSGIGAHILRSPQQLSSSGCSHCVKIAQRSLTTALTVLKRAGLTPTRVFITESDGSYREVAL